MHKQVQLWHLFSIFFSTSSMGVLWISVFEWCSKYWFWNLGIFYFASTREIFVYRSNRYFLIFLIFFKQPQGIGISNWDFIEKFPRSLGGVINAFGIHIFHKKTNLSDEKQFWKTYFTHFGWFSVVARETTFRRILSVATLEMNF